MAFKYMSIEIFPLNNFLFALQPSTKVRIQIIIGNRMKCGDYGSSHQYS